MKFDVYGPYTVRRENKQITKTTREGYLQLVESGGENWQQSRGCYILAVSSGKGGWNPWYVGMAEKTSLHKEALSVTNIVNFNEVLKKKTSATPAVFLLPKLTPAGKFSTDKNRIADLETMLIGMATMTNSQLLNISKTKIWKQTEIAGVMNTSTIRATNSAMLLRKTLSLKNSIG